MKTIRTSFFLLVLLTLSNVVSAQEGKAVFSEKEVSFKSGDAVYSGTLSVPSEKASYPLVIMVSGMGPQDRDWSFAGGKYKMARIIAGYLASNGIAVYRYDDRGFGKSTGTEEGLMSFPDLAKDVENAVDFFRTRPEFSKIGLCGHSLGGILSVIAGAEKKDIDFIITLSGSFRNGADIMREQAATLKRWKTSSDMTDEQVVAQGVKFVNNLVNYATNGQGEDTIRHILSDLINYQISKMTPEKMAENLKVYKDKDDMFRKNFDEAFAFYTSPHQKSFVTYNAAGDISKISCPLLVLFGEKDKHVVVESNRPPVAAGLANSMTADFTMRIVPGADHGYSTKELYPKGEMIPGLLDYMTNWILLRTTLNTIN
jgi:pimeloyl-ACP methyl ester carboxylesterase